MNLDISTNRSFLYGDGFFETFKLMDGRCDRFTLHYERLLLSISTLQMEINPLWSQAFFEEKLYQESKKFKESILKARIIFYRDAKGTYLPESDTANFCIKLEPYFPTHKLDLTAGIYSLAKKPINFLSSLKTTSSLMFVMAAKYAKENGWDEVIILNEHGRVCEALTSNIFIKIEGMYYTPPLSEGCIDGVNRKAFLLANPDIIERPIVVSELKDSEVYFSNAVRGMVKGEVIIT
jgi:branched-subunit amino acid aminotransferase/4-amino-4-deoxychorismate lyase